MRWNFFEPFLLATPNEVQIIFQRKIVTNGNGSKSTESAKKKFGVLSVVGERFLNHK